MEEKIFVSISFWDRPGLTPYREIRLYDRAGTALGYGIEKLSDSAPLIEPMQKKNDGQLDIFSSTPVEKPDRTILFTATIDLTKLKKE